MPLWAPDLANSKSRLINPLAGNHAGMTDVLCRIAAPGLTFPQPMSLKHAEHHRPKSHTHVAAATLSRIQVNKRRSNRMSLNASVGLSGEDRLKVTFTMPAKATNLNRHGAAVQLSRDLPVGTIVTMKNRRGAEVSARIVSVIAAVQGLSTYGIEFVEQDDRAQQFWGISFPKNA